MKKKSESIVVPCEWEKLPKSAYSSPKEKVHRRCGRYHQSAFYSVPDYGTARWVVCGYLKIKEPEKFEHLTESQLVEGCAAFLNTPPPRKRKSLYGNLEPVRATWRDDGEYEVKMLAPDRMIVCFSTDQRRNKNFWGDGLSLKLKEDGRKTRWKKKK